MGAIVEKLLHPQRTTVWCGSGAEGIVIRPFFVPNTAVSGARYGGMMLHFLCAFNKTVPYALFRFDIVVQFMQFNAI